MADEAKAEPVATPPAETRERLEVWPPQESVSNDTALANVREEKAATAAAADVKPAAVLPAEKNAAPVAGKEPAKGDEKPPTGKDTPEKRIARASYFQRDAERREQEVRDELARTQAELRAVRNKPSDTPAATPTPVVGDKFPIYEAWTALPGHEGDDYETYLDARDDWRVAKRGYVSQADVERIASEKAAEIVAAQRREAEEHAAYTAEEARRLAFAESREEAKTKHEDFGTVVEESDLETNPLMDEYVRRSGPMAGELLYYLGTHPEDCQRIAALRTAAEVIEEMALVKHGLAGAPPSGPSVKPKPVTKAPPPIQPLGSRGAASTGSLASLTLDEFRRVRDEQERAAAGRI